MAAVTTGIFERYYVDAGPQRIPATGFVLDEEFKDVDVMLRPVFDDRGLTMTEANALAPSAPAGLDRTVASTPQLALGTRAHERH